jgi:hypothetical protein
LQPARTFSSGVPRPRTINWGWTHTPLALSMILPPPCLSFPGGHPISFPGGVNQIVCIPLGLAPKSISIFHSPSCCAKRKVRVNKAEGSRADHSSGRSAVAGPAFR